MASAGRRSHGLLRNAWIRSGAALMSMAGQICVPTLRAPAGLRTAAAGRWCVGSECVEQIGEGSLVEIHERLFLGGDAAAKNHRRHEIDSPMVYEVTVVPGVENDHVGGLTGLE